jgi:signal transduction histidine kinase
MTASVLLPCNATSAANDDWLRRVLVLAPNAADALIVADVLAKDNTPLYLCGSIEEMRDCLEKGAGALLIDETLVTGQIEPLVSRLASQESWSDIPIIVLTTAAEDASSSEMLATWFAASGNLTLIERPLRATRLAVAARIALRARRRQYEARERLVRERTARADAEEANCLKDDFLATLSHELRNPLAITVAWSRALLSKFGVHDAELRHGLEIIFENAMAQTRLISDLVDMSRIIWGKLSLETHPTELATLVDKAVCGHRPAADAKGVSIELHQALHGASVLADPTRLKQVFWNLLSNAIKFTPEGGHVTVTIRTSRLECFEVIVRDTGEGIATDFLPHLFERFRQADCGISRRHGGLGLGLAIAKQLVEMHGGSIEAFSDGLGRGACFTVCLPAHRTDSPVPESGPTGLSAAPLPSKLRL